MFSERLKIAVSEQLAVGQISASTQVIFFDDPLNTRTAGSKVDGFERNGCYLGANAVAADYTDIDLLGQGVLIKVDWFNFIFGLAKALG